MLLSALSLALLVALGFFAAQVPWVALWRSWSELQGMSLGLILTALGLSHLLRGERLRLLLDLDADKRLQAYSISTWHTASNNLLPMRSGEVSLPIMLRKRLNRDWSEAWAVLLLVRGMDLLCMLWVAAICSQWPQRAGLVIVLLSGAAASILLLSALPKLVRRLALRWPRLKPLERWGWQKTLPVFLLTLSAWLTKFGALVALACLLLPLPPHAWASALLAGELSSISPVHGPAGLGSYEAAVLAGLSLFYSDWEHALGVALCVHISLLLASIVTAILLQSTLTIPSLFRPSSVNRSP